MPTNKATRGSVRKEGIIGMTTIPLMILSLLYVIYKGFNLMPFTLFGLSVCFGAVVISLIMDEMYSMGPLVDSVTQNSFWGGFIFCSASVL